MRAVLQRVGSARVIVAGEVVGKIQRGWLVLLGVGSGDGEPDVQYLVQKIAGLRAFPDGEGKMNLSIQDIAGEILVVSQFTLYADCRKGRRPSFTDAAAPPLADALYRRFTEELRRTGIRVETGVFQAEMSVELTNDGPVTMLLESPQAI